MYILLYIQRLFPVNDTKKKKTAVLLQPRLKQGHFSDYLLHTQTKTTNIKTLKSLSAPWGRPETLRTSRHTLVSSDFKGWGAFIAPHDARLCDSYASDRRRFFPTKTTTVTQQSGAVANLLSFQLI